MTRKEFMKKLDADKERVKECDKKSLFLTLYHALQWRLQYARVIALDNRVDGVINYEW